MSFFLFCGLALLLQSNVWIHAAIPNIDLNPFAKAHTEFSLDLYKKAAHSASITDNLFFSPYSISTALGLVQLGARGSSLNQINNALHLSQELQQQFHSIQSFISAFINKNESYSLHVVSKLFGERTYHFLQDYLDITRQAYGSELQEVDFRNDAQGATDLINGWVSDHTNEKIRNLIPQGLLTDLTRLVLVNAIHFKGQWLHQFQDHLTGEEDFHVDDEETVRVHLMKQRGTRLKHAVASDLHAEILEMPFTEDLAFYIVLPNQGTSLAEVESHLSTDVLDSLNFNEKSVNLWLPRFKLDLEFELKNRLKELGVEDIFEEGVANLSGIDGTTDLYVSDALHKAFIDVKEEGAEAAAATAFVISVRSSVSYGSAPVEFKVDRPFFFYLKDLRANLIYFIGRCVRP